MPSRDDYTLILEPWEHRAASFDARPDLLVENSSPFENNGQKHLFLLKVRANRVFFRLSEDASRIWGTIRAIEDDAGKRLEQPTESEVIAFWKREWAQRRIGRLFAKQFDPRGRPTWMGVLINGHEVWLCEWCSDIWWQGALPPIAEKYIRTHQKYNAWHQQWQPPIYRIIQFNREALYGRLMPESERTNTEMRWIRGSEVELQTLLNHFCVLQADKLNRIIIHSGRQNKFSFMMDSESIESHASLRCWEIWGREDKRLQILYVFAQYNRVAGVRWYRWGRKPDELHPRGEWQHGHQVGWFHFEVPSLTPAEREKERALAREYLRHWLQDKTSETNIDVWLRTD